MGYFYHPDIHEAPLSPHWKRKVDDWSVVQVSRDCSTVKSKRRRVVEECAPPDDHLGDIGALPAELVDVILHKCGSRELGVLNCVSRHFRESYLTERIAKERCNAHPILDKVVLEDQYHAPIGKLGASDPKRKAPNYARLLDFIERSDTAARMSACLSLGAFHTAVLGVAEAVPGLPPARRVSPKRTDARSFCNRRDIADVPPFQMDAAATQYRWGDAGIGLLGDANGQMAGAAGAMASLSEDEDSRPATETVHTALAERRDEFGVGVAANTETVCECDPLEGMDAFPAMTRVPGEPAKDDALRTDDCEIITPAAAAVARERAQKAQPRGRTMYTFGRGFHGQLGQGGYDDAAAPAAVTFGAEAQIADATAIESVSCGASHCAALDPDGALMTWGLASSGELGHGGWTPIEVDIPRRVNSMSGVKVTQIATGANHTVVVSEGGGLWTCGRGRHGQLGHGHFNDAGPLQRLEALRGMNVTQAVAGGSHTVCLTDCGSVWSWGACRYGQLGLGDVAFATAAGWESGVPWPCLVEHLNDLDEPVTSLAAGGHHTLFVTAGGQLWACGRGKHGALGIGVKGTHSCYYYYEEDQRGAVRGPNDELVPRLVPVHHKPEPENPPSNANEVPRERNTIKRAFEKAFEKTGRKKTPSDAEGNEDALFAPTPLPRKGPRGRRLSVCHDSAGRADAFNWERERDSAKAKNREAIRALYDDAKKKNAEEDWEGRTPKNGVWIKVPCACGDRCKIVRAAAGGNHSAVLTACGAVMTTGSNSYGQLGHGDVKKRYAFTRVESLRGSRLATVDCGEDHTGAVGDSGRLYLWGRGDWGQLGSGDGRSHWSPAPVNGVSVAPPVAREHFRAYDRACDVDENERVRREKELAEREMGGPNQHLVADAAAAVYQPA